MASMISATINGAKKTHLMYRSNLSYLQLQYYLAFLEEHGLIKKISNPSIKTSIYRATYLGLKFLKDYKKLMRYLIDSTLLRGIGEESMGDEFTRH